MTTAMHPLAIQRLPPERRHYSGPITKAQIAAILSSSGVLQTEAGDLTVERGIDGAPVISVSHGLFERRSGRPTPDPRHLVVYPTEPKVSWQNEASEYRRREQQRRVFEARRADALAKEQEHARIADEAKRAARIQHAISRKWSMDGVPCTEQENEIISRVAGMGPRGSMTLAEELGIEVSVVEGVLSRGTSAYLRGGLKQL